MKLKTSKEEVFKVNYRDIEQLITETYGREYELPCDMESCNDTSIDVSVDGKIDSYNARHVKEWVKTGKSNYLLPALMEDLCKNGHIEKGTYIIDVSW